MPKNSICIKVPKKEGEKAITIAYRLKIINRELEIQRDNSYIHIPLEREPTLEELEIMKKEISNIEISVEPFPERKKQKTLLEALENKLPPHLLASIPRAMDVIGDIAVIEVPAELEPYRKELGEAILHTQKGIKTVLAKESAVDGIYRLRKYSLLAGEQRTMTVHKEYGCRYYVDLARAYFSPRLSYEHSRVASQVKENETVIDMFAGVGPFSVLIAKSHEKVKVYAIDINPDAIELLKKNIKLNKVTDKVYPVVGDAKQIIKEKLRGLADRVVMNLPEKSMEFIDASCLALKPNGGIIHFYSFIKTSESIEDLQKRFREEVNRTGRHVKEILFSRVVREIAPYKWQVVIDSEIG
ncbi:MAG: class I SAM-dependent methyltransferase family protein [Candidatus Bathyarchaeia archaeon]